jgi:hypothetical protein
MENQALGADREDVVLVASPDRPWTRPADVVTAKPRLSSGTEVRYTFALVPAQQMTIPKTDQRRRARRIHPAEYWLADLRNNDLRPLGFMPRLGAKHGAAAAERRDEDRTIRRRRHREYPLWHAMNHDPIAISQLADRQARWRPATDADGCEGHCVRRKIPMHCLRRIGLG